MLRALDEAHRLGIVHRDIKPSNLLVSGAPGAPFHVTVLDFGIAKPTRSTTAQLTKEGTLLGTPRYMSPEQMRGEEVGPPTDLFALGLVSDDPLRVPDAATSGPLGRVIGRALEKDR